MTQLFNFSRRQQVFAHLFINVISIDGVALYSNIHRLTRALIPAAYQSKRAALPNCLTVILCGTCIHQRNLFRRSVTQHVQELTAVRVLDILSQHKTAYLQYLIRSHHGLLGCAVIEVGMTQRIKANL